jgi:hypothetical protein
MKERFDLDRAALDGAKVTVVQSVELSRQIHSRSTISQLAGTEGTKLFAKLAANSIVSKCFE